MSSRLCRENKPDTHCPVCPICNLYSHWPPGHVWQMSSASFLVLCHRARDPKVLTAHLKSPGQILDRSDTAHAQSGQGKRESYFSSFVLPRMQGIYKSSLVCAAHLHFPSGGMQNVCTSMYMDFAGLHS
ncbi:hypothetical protein BaRGS_00018694 [Batillaria attramentaria]|uniref:Uncharacterized protein n=1 Tax=Batillaria attramentaria TaxID=370345 RepID=A0ABD0KS09_9CAEN